MPASKIAILVAGLEEPSAWDADTRLLLDLVHVAMRQANGSIEAEFISCGRCSAQRTLSNGVRLRMLPMAAPPVERLDALSWNLGEAIANADLVHIHHVGTRLGEVAMLAAKLQHKPICVSETATASSSLGTE